MPGTRGASPRTPVTLLPPRRCASPGFAAPAILGKQATVAAALRTWVNGAAIVKVKGAWLVATGADTDSTNEIRIGFRETSAAKKMERHYTLSELEAQRGHADRPTEIIFGFIGGKFVSSAGLAAMPHSIVAADAGVVKRDEEQRRRVGVGALGAGMVAAREGAAWRGTHPQVGGRGA